MGNLRTLMDEAARLEVRVQLAHIEHETIVAHYDHEQRMITIDLSLTMAEVREALAHELGHAFYGHTCSTDSTERQAFRRAARLLIDPNEYRAAELRDPEPQAIADELGVTRRMVRVWQKEWMPSLSLARRYG